MQGTFDWLRMHRSKQPMQHVVHAQKWYSHKTQKLAIENIHEFFAKLSTYSFRGLDYIELSRLMVNVDDSVPEDRGPTVQQRRGIVVWGLQGGRLGTSEAVFSMTTVL